ncbi:hypothetical protein C8J56DRAFT_921594 [Mycena floridula]|nr:hypothetical protein C8J56DRAFT_921594 [Mycena floridula]
MPGKVTTVKVRGGPDPEKRIEFDISLYKRIRHPAFLRYINYVTPALPPFTVYASVVSGCNLRGRISTGWSSVPSDLAVHCHVGDNLIVSAQLMCDVMSGLNLIINCLPFSEIMPGQLSVLIQGDAIGVSLGMVEVCQGHDDPGDPVFVFQRLCYEAFREGNRESHRSSFNTYSPLNLDV